MSNQLPFFLALLLIPLQVAAQPVSKRALPATLANELTAIEADERNQALLAQAAASELSLISTPTADDPRHVEVVRVTASGHPVVFTTHNLDAGALTRSHLLHPGGRYRLDLTGRGVQIGLWDSGPVKEDHQEFGGRIERADAGARSNHATHVAGTMIARGTDASALGMAPQASIKSYNWNFHVSEMQEEAKKGLLISNHSYGRIAGWHSIRVAQDSSRWYWFGDPAISEYEDYTFGFYDQDARLFDLVTSAHPYFLPVVSAGNERDDTGPSEGVFLAIDSRGRWQEFDLADRPIPADGGARGFDSMTSFALAKNVLTVGSISLQHAGIFSSSNFSSYGPTDDGRIKPDIMGYGESVYSSIAAGVDQYSRYTGTSMAAPNVAGSLALLQQYAQNELGYWITSASLRGLVIHTAEDLGLLGPDYSFGWGLLNTERAAVHLQESLEQPIRLVEDSLSNNGHASYDLIVNRTGSLKVTLVWTDLPGEHQEFLDESLLNNPSPKLVNDLDLRIIREDDGAVFYPYVLNPAVPEAPATQGDNIVDPVEQVYLATVPTGLYRAEVYHKGPLADEIPQHFSLLVTGAQELYEPVIVERTLSIIDPDFTAITLVTSEERVEGRFELERARVQSEGLSESLGLQYTLALTLPSQGPSAEGYTYTFKDPATLKARYHYRIFFVEEATDYRVLLAEEMVDRPAPPRLSLVSNFPNPFQDRTELVVDLPEDGGIRIAIYDLLGREVGMLVDGDRPAGRHIFSLDTQAWAAGVYLAMVETPAGISTRRMILMR